MSRQRAEESTHARIFGSSGPDFLARLAVAEPGRWVLKGGMALEVRLDTDARVTKDIDLGLRDEEIDADVLHNRLIDALSADPHGDRFELAAAMPELLTPDSPGGATWRVKVDARLAGKTFGRVKLDIAPRPHELDQTDELELPNALAFAGIPPTTAEVVDLHRHVAEKFHAMLRTFGERENSRVRDLYDVALLIEHDLLQPTQLAEAAERVWSERDGTAPPSDLPTFPARALPHINSVYADVHTRMNRSQHQVQAEAHRRRRRVFGLAAHVRAEHGEGGRRPPGGVREGNAKRRRRRRRGSRVPRARGLLLG